MLRSPLPSRSRTVLLMTVNRTATQDSRASCEAVEEAERVAYICAAYRQPCELACDAYHRDTAAPRTDRRQHGSCAV
jgi:hypothetical protein